MKKNQNLGFEKIFFLRRGMSAVVASGPQTCATCKSTLVCIVCNPLQSIILRTCLDAKAMNCITVTQSMMEACLRRNEEQTKQLLERTKQANQLAATGAAPTAAPSLTSSAQSEIILASQAEELLEAKTATNRPGYLVDKRALQLLRGLESNIRHLGPESSNYTIHQFLPACKLSEQDKALVMSVNKSPRVIANEVHLRQNRITNFSSKCARRPKCDIDLVGTKVLIGSSEYYLCHVIGQNCTFFTFFEVADILRWKILRPEDASSDVPVYYVDL
jgi:hypothetical protein